eukprot:TRINITY_DN10626_c0_g1_i1.p1 TRINITY_DN10626_c0_g1~~TRINITY_DN10626_c0_g1_i1.p1  ORF type:complete len:436 (-),score=100.30 TRINITY_DN10626_c0_g1_i1:130-1437(-)
MSKKVPVIRSLSQIKMNRVKKEEKDKSPTGSGTTRGIKRKKLTKEDGSSTSRTSNNQVNGEPTPRSHRVLLRFFEKKDKDGKKSSSSSLDEQLDESPKKKRKKGKEKSKEVTKIKIKTNDDGGDLSKLAINIKKTTTKTPSRSSKSKKTKYKLTSLSEVMQSVPEENTTSNSLDVSGAYSPTALEKRPKPKQASKIIPLESKSQSQPNISPQNSSSNVSSTNVTPLKSKRHHKRPVSKGLRVIPDADSDIDDGFFQSSSAGTLTTHEMYTSHIGVGSVETKVVLPFVISDSSSEDDEVRTARKISLGASQSENQHVPVYISRTSVSHVESRTQEIHNESNINDSNTIYDNNGHNSDHNTSHKDKDINSGNNDDSNSSSSTSNEVVTQIFNISDNEQEPQMDDSNSDSEKELHLTRNTTTTRTTIVTVVVVRVTKL